MRIQGIWKIIKKKHELSLIIAILAFSFAILSAVSIVSDTYQMQVFSEIMDESLVDFRVTMDTGLDPSEDFEQYLSNYDGWLRIEYRYKTEVISISHGLLNLTYRSESQNFSDLWDFQNSITEIFFVGIDESTFNLLINGSKTPIIDFNGLTYAQLEEGFMVANVLRDYQPILPELNCVISTNASNREDLEMVMKVDIFNKPAFDSLDILPNVMTKTNANLSLISPLEIWDEKQLYSLLGLEQWQAGYPIFLCGEKLLDQFINFEDSEIPHIGKSTSVTMKFDRVPILQHSPQALLGELAVFRSASIDPTSEFRSLWIIWGEWHSELSVLTSTSNRFQLYSIIAFIPIFLLCGKYLKTSFSYLIEKRRSEFGLYLINGMEIKSLKRILLGIGFLTGAIGGLMGAIGGIFLTQLIGSQLFPTTSHLSTYLQLDTWPILLQNGLVNLIVGGLFAVSTMKTPLDMLNQQELQANLVTNPSLNSEEDTSNPIRNGALLIFLVSLILAYIYDITLDVLDYTILMDEYPLIYWVIFLLGPIMGLFPFIFPALLISWVGDKLGYWIEIFRRKRYEDISRRKLQSAKVTSSKPSRKGYKPPSYLKKLTTWNLSHKLNKNKNLLEIYALAVIFISISINLGSSYVYSESVHATLYHANGEILNVELSDDQNILDFRQFTQNMQANASQYGFDTINAFYHTQLNEARYDDSEVEWNIQIDSVEASSLWGYCFSWVNYSTLFHKSSFRDEWIIGGTPEDILARMQTPGSILIPQYLLAKGVTINETLSFTYRTSNGTSIQKEGVVIGAYAKFPASYMERDYDEGVDFEIYMSLDLIQDARIELIELVYYSEGELTEVQKTDLSQYIYDNLATDFSLRFMENQQYYDPYDSKIFDLFQIEGYLLVVFAFFGFIVYSLIDSFHTNVEIALLRAKGVVEKDLFKSGLYETLILVGLGSILSLISTVGTKGLILYLNFQRIGSSESLFYLFYQMNWKMFFLITLLGSIFFFAISVYFNFVQLRTTRFDKNLEILMRTSK